MCFYAKKITRNTHKSKSFPSSEMTKKQKMITQSRIAQMLDGTWWSSSPAGSICIAKGVGWGVFKAELQAAKVDPRLKTHKLPCCKKVFHPKFSKWSLPTQIPSSHDLFEEVICVGKLYFEKLWEIHCLHNQSEHNQHQIVRRLRPWYLYASPITQSCHLKVQALKTFAMNKLFVGQKMKGFF